ncbi:saccharopine dehydrogenase family protein [Lacibacter sp. H407]|uniref:saccharopine dehydrogenase family protein n=1 Tax=Lacibacter sp. H407 TaxID=3133423 RepID=UPI0030BB77BC
MHKIQVLLYGANGYTGELIARYAKEYGITPVLAGRNETLIRSVAERLQLPYRIFSLDDVNQLQQQLQDVQLVIHAAGPFANTCKQMVEACIATNTHYIDINGDISVFERIKKYGAAARQANVMLMPGAGFDVIPTDCTALHLKEQLPDATHLQLAFLPKGGQISHGTATTMASRLGEGGTARENGKLVSKPLGHKSLSVDINGKKLFTMTIPWGDISTAYHTTGIENIEVYTGMKPTVYRFLKFQFLFNWILRKQFVRSWIQQKINSRPAGPTDEQRATAKTTVWGKVWNAKGETKTSVLECADGYSVTAWGCLLITQKIMKGDLKTGYQTPASCYGKDLILEIPKSKRIS